MATPNKTYEDKSGNTFKTRDEALRSNQSQTNVTAPLGSTERTNQLLGGNYFDTTTNKQIKTFTPVITSDNLKPTPQITLPNAPISNFGNIDTAINASLSTAKQDKLNRQNKAIEDAKTAKDNNLKDILDIQNILGQSGQKQEQAYQEQGVDTLRTQYDDFTNQLEQEQQVLKRKLERIEKNPEGVSETGLQERLRTTERESLSKQADLAVLQNSALRKYDTARDIADRKVQLELEPLKAKLETMKFIYQENKDIFNTQEKRQYEDLIRQEERQYKTEEENKQSINSIMLEAAKNGAGQSVISQISSAKTPAQALVLGAKYMTDPIEQAIKSKQLKKLEQEIASNNVTLTNPTVGGSTQSLAQKMMNSASQKGDLSQTEREKLAKMALVVQQLDTLQTSIKKSNSTGLIKGRVNNLLANLGANPDAGYINAQIQALIPNVARGIYGEVGVLTDADIENYKRTLPNIKTIQQQNDLVLAMTLKNAALSYENALKSAVNSNINVAGWTEDYTNIKKQVADIEDRAGISKAKVGKVYEDESLQPIIDDLVRAGATDREILQLLGRE